MTRGQQSNGRLNGIRSVVVVGSSGCGKTTLVSGIRTPPYCDHVVVPRRLVTRRARQGEDPRENRHIDRDLFQRLAETGRLDPCWNRVLERGREERYGFESVDATDGRLRIYSANNGFVRDPNPSVQRVLDSALVVVATTGQESRRARLAGKDMSNHERAVRLADEPDDIVMAGRSIRVIDTSGLTPVEGQRVFQEVVDTLLGAITTIEERRAA
jgi:ribose 1,5-bisphosphokinase PhnN